MFAEVEPDKVNIAVRDRGKGFDPAAVPDRHLYPLGLDLGVQRDHAGAGPLRRVDRRLAGRGEQRVQVVVERAVADGDDLDGHPVPRLDVPLYLPDALDERGRVPVSERAPLEQPGAQLAFLRPGELDDLLWVVGVPLDKRERLQHRVVHAGGDVGPFLRPGSGLAFQHQVAGDPQPPRPEKDHDPGGHQD